MSSHSFDGGGHSRRSSVSNGIEPLTDGRGYLWRDPGAKETLDGSLCRHINASNRFAENLRQNTDLLRHTEELTARELEYFLRKIRRLQCFNDDCRNIRRGNRRGLATAHGVVNHSL